MKSYLYKYLLTRACRKPDEKAQKMPLAFDFLSLMKGEIVAWLKKNQYEA